MATYPFRQVDVFCVDPPAGNALAVVLDADGPMPMPMPMPMPTRPPGWAAPPAP